MLLNGHIVAVNKENWAHVVLIFGDLAENKAFLVPVDVDRTTIKGFRLFEVNKLVQPDIMREDAGPIFFLMERPCVGPSSIQVKTPETHT